MWDRGGVQDQAGGAAIPALGPDPKQECWSPTAITFCLAPGTLGIVTALQGCACCPFLASWCWAPLEPGTG